MPDGLALRKTRTTCPYCGVGCGIVATDNGDGRVLVAGDPEHPANKGRLCGKGAALGETLGLEGRLLYPLVGGRRVAWDDAIATVAEGFRRAIDDHGPDSIAFYVSGQLLTEDYYVANKLMKGFIGSANIDTNSRLCMASSVAGHRRAFGTDTVPGCYEDLELADLVVAVGSNYAWCHPVLSQRLADAKAKRPDLQIVLIDPRRSASAELADMHLAIRPDSDVALFNGLLRWLQESGCADGDYVARHTGGFDAALAAAKQTSLGETARLTGLSLAELIVFYRLFALKAKVVTLYSQGVNQSRGGTDKVNAILNCHLLTGRVGKPGCGPFSLTGQPNAMGGREVGGLANQLACHMEIDNPQHRALVQGFWNSPAMPDKAGLKAVDLFDAVAAGRIRALWIMGTNPAVSLPQADRVRAAIRDCPFVVVSDVESRTDTTEVADVLLPAAAWGEKDGTVTNSERRISRQRAFLPLPGAARPDWQIVCDVATAMGWGDAFGYRSPWEIFREYAALTAAANGGSRDLDLSGCLDWQAADYDTAQPFQWPHKNGDDPAAGPKRFFAEGGFFTADRRARFIAVTPPAALTEERSALPFLLNTGRVRDQWHTMTRSGRSPRLSQHVAEPFVEIHPADADRLGVAPAGLIRLSNHRGSYLARAVVTTRQREGQIFAPMHWNGQNASSGRIDALVAPRTDPVSGQPALKSARVRAEAFAVRWYGFAVVARKPREIAADYWAVAPTETGWRIELGGCALPAGWQDFARQLFGLGDAEVAEFLAYGDAMKGNHRVAAFDGGRALGVLYVAAEPVVASRSWVCQQFDAGSPDCSGRRLLLAGRAGQGADPGPIVCSCFAVGRNTILAALASGEASTVAQVGAVTSAGSNCGSCRAEIQGMIDHVTVQAAE